MTFNVIGSDLNRYNATFNTDSPQRAGVLSMDLDSYFGNYALGQRQAAMNQLNGRPTSAQYIQAIANAAPTICGGGVFADGSRSLDAGPASGFAGGIIEADSGTGVCRGALFEAGGGEGYMGGGGMIVSNDGGGLGSSNLAYGGVGGGVPGAHVGAGLVGFSSGVGAYGEVSAGGREVGVGAYLNVTANAGCLAR